MLPTGNCVHGYSPREVYADGRQVIADLYRTVETDWVFNYTFFKARGVK
jgi:hypothetical protein